MSSSSSSSKALLALVSLSPMTLSTFTTATTTTTTILTTTADATIREASPAINYGDWDSLEFIAPSSTGGLSTKVETILQFDLTELSSSSRSDVESARLTIRPTDGCNFQHILNSEHLGLLAVGLAENGGEWRESTLNWGNAPPLLEGGGTMVVPLGGLSPWIEYEIEITSFLTSTDDNSSSNIPNVLNLRLSSILFAYNDSFASCSFASKEYQNGEYAPNIIVKYNAPVVTENVITTGGCEGDASNCKAESKITTLQGAPQKQTAIKKPAPASAMVTILSNCEEQFSIATEDINSIESQKYQAGDIVSNSGKNYRCKPYPYTTWCNQVAYTPGESSFWAMAWDLVGECRRVDQSIHKKDTEENPLFVKVQVMETLEPHSTASSEGSLESMTNNANAVISGITNPCPLEWQPNQDYQEFDKVTDRATLIIYECKEWPTAALCSDDAHAISTGPLFRDSWREVGKCVGGHIELHEMESVHLDDLTFGNAESSYESITSDPSPFPTFLTIASPTTRPTVQPTRQRSRNPTNVPTSTPTNPTPTESTPLEGIALNLDEQHAQLTQDLVVDQQCGPPFHPKAIYSEAEIASKGGLNFVCTLPSWCGMPNFEPLEGKFWKVVWTLEGPCSETMQVEDAFDGVVQDLVLDESNPTSSKHDDEPSTETSFTQFKPVEKPSVPGDEPGEEKCPEPWILDKVYAAGDLVGAQGQKFACKEFPYNGWCGLAAYEPGLGAHYSMAWDSVGNCVGQGTRPPTPPPTERPTRSPVKASKPGRNPTSTETDDDGGGSFQPVKGQKSARAVFDILENVKDRIDNEIFLYQGSEPSTVYRYEGFRSGLEIMFESGVAGKFFYLGDDSPDGHLLGLVNIAAFLGQSMKETIQYDACDENSWDLVNSKYPLSNACGQLGQSYQDYHCSEAEKHMECPLDPNMSIKAVTHAKWYGAPGPLFCGPKTEYPFTGYWDYGYGCNNPWADPPEYCTDYEDQKAGRYDNTSPVENSGGRTDVENCCWWGRGVIQTTGVCNFGKLNYFLGARAAEEGRPSRYPTIDFCKDPEIICSSKEFTELKWIAGMFYWIESLQSYNERGWEYFTELHKFVDGGMSDHSFINAVSGIVNRGCHDPPCGTGEVDGMHERAGNFEKVLTTFIQ